MGFTKKLYLKMKIQPTGGLSNRLRVIFSYKRILNENEKLEILWKIDDNCNGHFLDYFEPINNVVFVNEVNEEINYKGCSSKEGVEFNYNDLILNKEMKRELDDRLSKLGNEYISTHIRRTDHIELSKSNNRFTTDDEFIDFFNKELNSKIFIATDNRETQQKFLELFKDRVVIFNEIKDVNTLRKTSLREAILDIYTCINSSKFKGSGYSSFSDLINKIRNEKIK